MKQRSFRVTLGKVPLNLLSTSEIFSSFFLTFRRDIVKITITRDKIEGFEGFNIQIVFIRKIKGV